MSPLFLLLLLGPAQTISGKYVQHSEEYRKLYPVEAPPVPAKLPEDVGALCRLIEAGHRTPQLFAALGDALLREGHKRLAYRAFDKAQRLEHPDPTGIVQRKDAATYVADDVIRAEEDEAARWVMALRSYERARIRAGADPRDLALFYERFGRPEDDLNEVIRTRRISFLGGLAGLFVGVAFAVGAPRVRKRAAAVPLLVAGACFLTPLMIGVKGLLPFGGCFALAGGVLVSWRGR